MKLKVIKTEAEHQAALERIEEIFQAQPGTAEGDELELLLLLVESFEEAQYPIAAPDPVSAIKFRMEQTGLRAKDLVPYIGSLGKVADILNGRRGLTLGMIRKLHQGLGIPAESLLGGVVPVSASA
jgi:HTH-type transcriptional regulator/antitoxin HigA